MPIRVRAFWFFSIAIVAYWVISDAYFTIYPGRDFLAVMAALPSELRDEAWRYEIITRGLATLFWGSVTLGLAWLAVFRRLNWARWAFVTAFLVRESIPLVLSIAYHQLDRYITDLTHENWFNPLDYVIPAMTIIAIASIFSGDARRWFRPVPAD